MTNENDWVTQDVVPRRPDVDEFRWIKKDGTATSWLLTPEDYNGLISGVIVLESRLEVRCKRKDHPVLGKVDIKPLPCPYCTLTTFKGWQDGKCPYCGRVRGVCSGMVSQDELNAEPRTRAWTFGKPAQTGHFLFSYKDPAICPQEIFANTIDAQPFETVGLWFAYLGQTSDFVDPPVPKAKYTLLIDSKEPRSKWLRRPEEIQDRLNSGWTIAAEQQFEVPEWDR
jgi:hypothetical protein